MESLILWDFSPLNLLVQERWLTRLLWCSRPIIDYLPAVQKSNIRQAILLKRAQTSHLASFIAAKKLIRLLNHLPCLNSSSKIASYLSFSNEISTVQLNQKLIEEKKHIYVPIIDRPKKNMMSFQAYTLDKRMRKNRFSILEPYACRRHQAIPYQLDTIFIPLVSFDHYGNRIGMGGGFYDRSLALFANKSRFQRPLLVGIAYHFQQVKAIPYEKFDIPLDYVLTDKNLLRCHKRSRSICPN